MGEFISLSHRVFFVHEASIEIFLISILLYWQGSNSHFELMLVKNGQPYYDFAPLPSEVFSESSILIRVNNSRSLDFESMTSTTFQVILVFVDNYNNSSVKCITIYTLYVGFYFSTVVSFHLLVCVEK